MNSLATHIETKVEAALRRAEGIAVSATDRALYLDLAESITRQATRWQQPSGMIADPVGDPGREVPTTTARYTAAVGHLLRAGRCLDLLDAGLRAMDWCCEQLVGHWRRGEVWHGAEFCVKDMMVLYEAARPLAAPERLAHWSECLQAPPPEAIYRGGHNWVFYATAAEVMRIRNGLSDRRDWVERALEGQMPQWTACGMYRDPNDPVTYDLTVRQALAMMLEHGYDGAHAQWARGVLRQGALATLLFVSPAGTAPYGGRSNQFHHVEGMIAYLAEWQAKQEQAAGNAALAGALRRMALAGAEVDRRWILQDPYFALKNQVSDPPAFGHDGYHPGASLQAAYGLLAANLFGGAYHVADPAIAAGPAPADAGGYALYLPDAFYRLWATAGGYHVQVDTQGQPGYDATGLGRLHRIGVPVEACLNMSIVANPSYHLPGGKAARPVALGVGWPAGDGWRYLSEAARDTHDADVEIRAEGERVSFAVTYRDREGKLGAPLVREEYDLSAEGLRARHEVPGAARVRLQVPVIETDGRHRSEVRLGAGFVECRYAGHAYRVRVPECRAAGVLEPWPAPNRNGVYRVAVFEVEGPAVSFAATLE